jgi:hypothetical protein
VTSVVVQDRVSKGLGVRETGCAPTPGIATACRRRHSRQSSIAAKDAAVTATTSRAYVNSRLRLMDLPCKLGSTSIPAGPHRRLDQNLARDNCYSDRFRRTLVDHPTTARGMGRGSFRNIPFSAAIALRVAIVAPAACAASLGPIHPAGGVALSARRLHGKRSGRCSSRYDGPATAGPAIPGNSQPAVAHQPCRNP